MRYGSVCSGIEAATVAWHPLGWKAAFYSEIEPFPSAVLAHHYPSVPNLGDMTKFQEWPDATLDVLVGGTPCQSFSVAGLRKGLADPRGNLMLVYGAIAARYRPRWLVWENVPGVLSSNGGRDFGTFLGMLAELGYGFAYRVLDAQFVRVQSHRRAVPQRRRRVFVVGCLGDWRRAAAVLFERESLRGDSAPSREAGKVVAGTIAKCSFSGGAGGRPEGAAGNHFLAIGVDEECNASIEHFGPLLRGGQGGTRQAVMCMSTGQASAEIGIGTTLNCNHEAPIVVHGTQDPCTSTEAAFALGRNNGAENALCYPVAFAQNSRDELREMAVVGALSAEPGMKQTSYIREGMQVRRLTPLECERLQGFPDGYTNIPVKGKMAADGPRYKALGNSMATNVMRHIGDRIEFIAAAMESE